MTIIKKGMNFEKSHTFQCFVCETTFEAKLGEYNVQKKENTIWAECECPNCGYIVVLNSKKENQSGSNK